MKKEDRVWSTGLQTKEFNGKNGPFSVTSAILGSKTRENLITALMKNDHVKVELKQASDSAKATYQKNGWKVPDYFLELGVYEPKEKASVSLVDDLPF